MSIAGLLQPAGGGVSISQPTQGQVGVKAISPSTNLSKPTTNLPPKQIAPNDLSSTYANVNGTIYNKKAGTKFSAPNDFFKDSGVSSFNNLKFDTAYKPTGSEQVYGAPQNTPTPQSPNGGQNNSFGALNEQQTPINANNNNTNQPGSQYYTPPNQGTTGVSQGGIIGNLLNNANAASSGAAEQYKKDKQALIDLTNANAVANANIEGSPIDLSLASGEKGILQRLFAAKQGALQTGIQNDLGLLNAGTTAASNAGNLNAPITGVPYGTQTIQPSQPNGATTSGAASLDSLVGQRPSATNPKVTEYYDKQTGQGFSTPQQLADFINKQTGGNTANAQNVFSGLQSGMFNTSSGSGNSLNPLNNLSSIAADVLAGRRSLSDAQSMGGSVAAWSNYLNQELQKQSGGTFDASAAQAKYDANQTTQGNQAQQKAAYQSAHQQASNLAAQLNDLISQFGLNPNDLNAANAGVQAIARNTSDARYKILLNYLTDIASRYAQVLTPTGGSQTDTVRDTAQGMLDKTASGQSIQSVIQALDQQAQAVISGVQTPSTTGQPSHSGLSSPTLGLF